MKGIMENMYIGQWSVASLELTEVTEVIDPFTLVQGNCSVWL